MPDTSAMDRLVWVDCEMTGLDLKRDELCEIACIVTEADLTPVDAGISIVIRPSENALAGMPDVVRDMHIASGLLPELAGGVDVREAEQQVLAYVMAHVPEPRKVPLAGSTVYVDRGFLARQMPALDAHLHYRLVDVSSLKELVRRWYPRVYFAAPTKTGNHRAMGDILDSIQELRYYRAAVLVPEPGPSVEGAREISAGLTASQ